MRNGYYNEKLEMRNEKLPAAILHLNTSNLSFVISHYKITICPLQQYHPSTDDP